MLLTHVPCARSPFWRLTGRSRNHRHHHSTRVVVPAFLTSTGMRSRHQAGAGLRETPRFVFRQTLSNIQIVPKHDMRHFAPSPEPHQCLEITRHLSISCHEAGAYCRVLPRRTFDNAGRLLSLFILQIEVCRMVYKLIQGRSMRVVDNLDGLTLPFYTRFPFVSCCCCCCLIRRRLKSWCFTVQRPSRILGLCRRILWRPALATLSRDRTLPPLTLASP